MKNEREIGTSLILPVWITAATALAAGLLFYLAPEWSPHGALLIVGVGLVAAGAQLAGRQQALGRIGSDLGGIATQMAEGRLDDADERPPAGSVRAVMLEARRSVRKTIDGVAADADEVSAGIGRLNGQTTEMALTLQLQGPGWPGYVG
jgi:hypothetical protein